MDFSDFASKPAIGLHRARHKSCDIRVFLNMEWGLQNPIIFSAPMVRANKKMHLIPIDPLRREHDTTLDV